MNNTILIIPILLPIILGAISPFINFKTKNARRVYIFLTALVESVLLFAMFISGVSGTFTLVTLAKHVTITLRIDGLTMVFGGLLAMLWPLATLYAFEYMDHEHRQESFFAFYTMTYGVAVGVAFSANLITMYLFYELLTLITLPIIMHEMDEEAFAAGRKYIIYSVAGAAFAFMGIMYMFYLSGTTDFVYGGVLNGVATTPNIMLAYVVCFLGFGVKAAVFPFHGWLPTAGVAPTPVTALLHAVAVVKAGVFALMRITYYSFGVDVVKGTAAQKIVMALAAITIVYGSAMALRQDHLKRRLAFSTVSNLSYIVFAVTLMSPLGFAAGLSHMLFHGVIKICLFFCAGALICTNHTYFISEMTGFGKKMPFVFGAFTVGSLALCGIPGFCGFISKWNITLAAVGDGSPLAISGTVALIISAILTAFYLFAVVIKAYFVPADFDESKIAHIKDCGICIRIPLIILCVLMVVLGLFSAPLIDFLNSVALGLI